MSDQDAPDRPSAARVALRAGARRVPGLYALCRLALETLRQCMRYRVTGLASEAGFFALLSFPPLIYGLLGVMGYVGGALGGRTVDDIVGSIERSLAGVLSDDALRTVLMPTLHDALAGGRPDVVSIGFLLSLWSGSRMINVIIDTISIMYGQGGERGIVRARSLSVALYFCSLLVMGVVLPLIVLGPDLLGRLLPPGLLFLLTLYWPVVAALTIVAFATLYYVATPIRTPWVRDLPGAAFTLLAWVVISIFLRSWLSASVGGISIYGPLAATIIVLIWLYFLSIAVLIGAAVNSAVARLWPVATAPVGVRARTRELLEEQVARVRSRSDDQSSTHAEAAHALEVGRADAESASTPYDQEDAGSSGRRHARPQAARTQTRPEDRGPAEQRERKPATLSAPTSTESEPESEPESAAEARRIA